MPQLRCAVIQEEVSEASWEISFIPVEDGGETKCVRVFVEFDIALLAQETDGFAGELLFESVGIECFCGEPRT